MRTFVHLLLTCALPVLCRAQVTGPQSVPAQIAVGPPIRPATYGRQPPPPPSGGFWVVESRAIRHSPTIIHYYTDDLREIRTDTLVGKQLNIRQRKAVAYLNNQLSAAMTVPPAPALATGKPIP